MIEIPPRLSLRPRDKRGLPIPYIVFIDKNGNPQFTINDSRKVMMVVRDNRCALCGKKMDNGVWFVGGPLAAFHERGVYLDPPNHKDCATYALRVCPFLAATKYSKRIDDKKLPIEEQAVITVDPRADPTRPSVFVLGHARSYRIADKYFVPSKPWKKVEWWRHGRPMTKEEIDARSEEVAKQIAEAP